MLPTFFAALRDCISMEVTDNERFADNVAIYEGDFFRRRLRSRYRQTHNVSQERRIASTRAPAASGQTADRLLGASAGAAEYTRSRNGGNKSLIENNT